MIFNQTLIVSLYCFIEFVLLLKDRCFPRQYLCFFYIIFSNTFFEQFLGFCDFRKCSIVFFELDISCGLIIVIKRLIWINFDSLVVQIKSVIELFFLKKLISFVFRIFGRILLFHFLIFWFFLFFRLWFRMFVVIMAAIAVTVIMPVMMLMFLKSRRRRR